jgi:hypothetical protein
LLYEKNTVTKSKGVKTGWSNSRQVCQCRWWVGSCFVYGKVYFKTVHPKTGSLSPCRQMPDGTSDWTTTGFLHTLMNTSFDAIGLQALLHECGLGQRPRKYISQILVVITTGYGLDGQGSIRDKEKMFSFSLSAQTCSGSQPAPLLGPSSPISSGYQGLFPRR